MKKKLFLTYGAAILGGLCVSGLVRTVAIEVYRVPTEVMSPAIENGETLLALKWSFGIQPDWAKTKLTQGRLPRLGEIVIYSPVEDPGHLQIRRVVGVPGDKIALKDGKLFRNGKPAVLQPSAQPNETCGIESLGEGTPSYTACWTPPTLPDLPEIEITAGKVFVVGDHRTKYESPSDKNFSPIVPVDSIRARARWIWISASGPSTGFKLKSIRWNRFLKSI